MTVMPDRTAKCRGFTLVEVLAALVLVGVVLPVAMRGITLSLRASALARHRLEAAELAQQKIAEHLVVRDASTFNDTGDFGAAWPEYRWASRGGVAGYGVYDLTVTVTWQDRDRERSVTLATLVYPVTGTEDVDAAEEAAP